MNLRLSPRIGWSLVALGAGLIAFYALFLYFVVPPVDRDSAPVDAFFDHRTGLLLHIVGSAVALVLGPVQLYLRRVTPLSKRARLTPWHRRLGRIYVGAVLLGAGTGLYIAVYAMGGIVAQAGFTGLALGTLGTTVLGFFAMRAGDEANHRIWMARSYALIFAAVTLRLYLPFLAIAFGFDNGYRIVAWLAWVPNLIVVEYMLRRPGTALRAVRT